MKAEHRCGTDSYLKSGVKQQKEANPAECIRRMLWRLYHTSFPVCFFHLRLFPACFPCLYLFMLSSSCCLLRWTPVDHRSTLPASHLHRRPVCQFTSCCAWPDLDWSAVYWWIVFQLSLPSTQEGPVLTGPARSVFWKDVCASLLSSCQRTDHLLWTVELTC